MTNINRCHELADTIEKSDSYYQDRYSNDCGTPACVAGQTVFQFDAKFLRFGVSKPYYFRGKEKEGELEIRVIEDEAAKLLGLNAQQADLLFDTMPIDEEPTNQTAAKVLRHLANTGKVDWKCWL